MVLLGAGLDTRAARLARPGVRFFEVDRADTQREKLARLDRKDLESRTFVADLGEPLRFGTDYPLPMVYEEGFRRVRTFSFDEICLDLTGTYDRQRAFRFQGIVLATRSAEIA